MPSIQRFCDAMRWAADSDQVGYSQSDRYSLGPSDFFGTGRYNTDCSALVVAALKHAGFDVGGATYTGNMSANLTARGWVRLPADGRPRKGDILLNDAHHVAVWLGDRLAQASIGEGGRVSGGARGDQTGGEVNTRTYYDYPWSCYLRYAGESEEDMTPDELMRYSLKGDNGYTADIGRRICRLDDKTQTLVDQVKAMNKTLAAIAKKL